MAEFVQRYKRYGQILSILAKHDMEFLLDFLGIRNLFHKKEETPDEKALVLASQDALHAIQKIEQEENAPTLPERVRMVFEDLGPTFVKLGQIMSTRPDLIPRAYITEFRKLQDKVKGIEWEEVKKMVEEELGESIEEAFSEFNQTALAAASIGQVHVCKLKSGEEAVVKVQRPGIDETIRLDLSILYSIARMAKNSAISKTMDMVMVVQEFERSILRELDFTSEGKTTEEFTESFREDPQVKTAKIYWDYTTKRLLTMEFLKGINAGDLPALKAAGVNLDNIARKVVEVTLQQVFFNGLFHADPHPGNLMVLPGEVLGIIDFGMVGRLDKYTLKMMREMLLDLVTQDYASMASHLLDHEMISYDTDMRQLRMDLRAMFRNLPSMNMAQQSEALQKFIFEHKLKVAADLFFLDKTFGTLDGTISLLAPHLALGKIAEKYFEKENKKNTNLKKIGEEIGLRLLNESDALIEIPSLLRRIFRRLDSGHFKSQSEVELSNATYARLNRVLLKLSLFTTSLFCFVFSLFSGTILPPKGLWGVGTFLLILSLYSLWKGSQES